jgi:copper chaperone NosL
MKNVAPAAGGQEMSVAPAARLVRRAAVRRSRRGTVTVPRLALVVLVASGCSTGAPEPAALDTRHESCAACRMSVSNGAFASQLVAPGEVARFFDDLGCLAGYLRNTPRRPRLVAYVADHRTRAWVRADRAVYTRVPALETPMGSHVIAHANAASRDADEHARGGTPVAPAELFGPAGAPAGADR